MTVFGDPTQFWDSFKYPATRVSAYLKTISYELLLLLRSTEKFLVYFL